MNFPPPPLSLSRHVPSLLQRSTSLPHLLQIHSLLLKTALDLHPHLAAQLVAALCPFSLDHARSIFDCLPSLPSLFAWNSMIRGYTEKRCPSIAFGLFSELRQKGLEPDNYTYPFVLKACGRFSMVGEGRMVHGLVWKVGFLPDSYVRNTLLHMYACCRDIECSRKMFEEMSERDVVSWSSMIEGCVACDCPLEALNFFCQMRLANIQPNSVTLVSLLSACSHLGTLSFGRSVHSHITVNDIKIDVALGTALISMYSKCGQVEEGFRVFTSMEEKSLQSWTVMISGLADHGHGREAISLFSRLESSGLKPDSVLFSTILNACSHSGFVDEGRELFRRMVNVHKIQPTVEHYGCMVDLLGRAGLVEDAYHFIQNMPISPSAVMLRSLLGACRRNGVSSAVESRVAQLLIEIEPGLAANYVLAANVAALSGSLGDAARLRSSIVERGLKKVPGCSWMEADGMTVKLCS